MRLTYIVTGAMQNRMNQLMKQRAPRYQSEIWLASLSCILLPFLVFGKQLTVVQQSWLLASSLLIFMGLQLFRQYFMNKTYGRLYQGDAHVGEGGIELEEQGFSIRSPQTGSRFYAYSAMAKVDVEKRVLIITGRSKWLEMIPLDALAVSDGAELNRTLERRVPKAKRWFKR